MFTKEIIPAYTQIGRRQRLTGYIGQITDEAGIVLHNLEYPSYSQAETQTNAIVYDLLMDQYERGLVDANPPGFPEDDDDSPDGGGPPRRPICATCGDDGDCDALTTSIITTMVRNDMPDYHIISQSPFCAEPDNLCSVHNPCPAHAADAARFLAQRSLDTWEPVAIELEDLPF